MSHTTWRTTTPTFRSKVFETLLCARKKAVVGGADPELDKGIGSGKTAHEVIEDYKYQKRQTMDGELSILGSGRSLKQKQSQKGKKNPKKGEDEEVTSSKASGNTTRTKYRTESEEQDYKWLFSPWNNQNQTNQDGEEVKKEKDKPNETVDNLEPKRATEALTQEQMKTGAVNSSKKKILQSNPDKHSLKREKKIDLLLTKTDQVSFPVENITNDTEKEKTPSSPSEEEIAEIPEDAEALYQEQQSIGKRSSKEPLSKKIENKVEKLLIGTGIKNTKSTNTTNANSTYKPVSNSDKDDKDSRKHSVQTSQNSHSLENNEALTLKKGISFRKSMRSSFDATKVMKEEDIDRLLKDDDETKPDTMISRVSGKLKVATKKKTRGSTSSGEETDDEEFHKFMSEVKKDELLKPPTLFTSKRLI